jgi:hypothetical protein
MFQSALLYLQQNLAGDDTPAGLVILPEVLINRQQSTRACRFLQYSFSQSSVNNKTRMTGILACHQTHKTDRQECLSYSRSWAANLLWLSTATQSVPDRKGGRVNMAAD